MNLNLIVFIQEIIYLKKGWNIYIYIYWIALYVNGDNVTNFDIPKEIKKFTRNKNIITNIYRMQAYDSIMFGYFCFGFVYFMFEKKNLVKL